MIVQLLTSFFASSAFGVLFNAPKKLLIHCGIAGMSGWAVYYLLTTMGIDSVPASLAASFLVAIISHFFAKRFRTPVIIFIVGGIIPLVPGGTAYDAMRKFVENDYNMAIQLSAKAFLISGAIVIGIVFSEVINQVIRKIIIERNKTYNSGQSN